MSWDIHEEVFDDFEVAKKAYPLVSLRKTYSDVIGNLEDARHFARVRDTAVVVPFVSSCVDSTSEKAQKLLADIQKVQEDVRKKISPLFQKFNVSQLKCRYCASLSNMSFSRQNPFPFKMALIPNESGATEYNIEMDRCVDEWRILDENAILHLFHCPVCKRADNVTADKVRKIVERANNKLFVLQKRLFADISGKTRVRYLVCWMERM